MASKIPANDLVRQLGFNPKTGLPFKFSVADKKIRSGVLAQLRIKDEQEFVNRFVVHTPGLNMSSHEFFRMLYYYPDLCLLHIDGKPYLMPYALEGGLDFYGRYNHIHPIPLEQNEGDKEGEQKKAIRELLKGFVRKPYYEIVLPEDVTEEMQEEACVLIRDYTPQRSNKILARCDIDETMNSLMADMFAYMRTALMTGSGVKGIRVNDPDAKDSVVSIANAIDDCALNSMPFVPLMTVSNLDLQELGGEGAMKAQDYMLAIQGIDNYRKQCLGIENNPMFDKKAYVNEAQAMMGVSTSHTLIDSLSQLQNSFDIWNSIYGYEWYVEMNPNFVANNQMMDESEADESEGGNDNESNQGNE